jgi:hypothetical protein
MEKWPGWCIFGQKGDFSHNQFSFFLERGKLARSQKAHVNWNIKSSIVLTAAKSSPRTFSAVTQ